MPQQECEQLLAGAHEVHGRIDTRPDQIAECFMRGVRHPYPRQVAGSV